MFDIVGIGEIGVDEVVRVDGEVGAGAKRRVIARERLGGGQVATAMVAAARLGMRCAFAGAVGDDEDGTTALAELTRDGVDVAAALRVRGARTRTTTVLVAPDGERTVIENVDERCTGAGVVAATRALHLDGTCISVAIPAATAARAGGARISLDLDHWPDGIGALAAMTDVLFVSRAALGSHGLDDGLRWLASTAAPGALVGCTLGADGAAALIDGEVVRQHAFHVDVVDTTACGDVFHAALLTALLDGTAPRAAMRFACTAASLKCRALGRLGCPTRAEVLAVGG